MCTECFWERLRTLDQRKKAADWSVGRHAWLWQKVFQTFDWTCLESRTGKAQASAKPLSSSIHFASFCLFLFWHVLASKAQEFPFLEVNLTGISSSGFGI